MKITKSLINKIDEMNPILKIKVVLYRLLNKIEEIEDNNGPVEVDIKTLNGTDLKGKGDVKTKTVNGQSLMGEGNIPFPKVDPLPEFKTVNSQTITGSGDIPFPKVEPLPEFKTVGGQNIKGTGDIPFPAKDKLKTVGGNSLVGDGDIPFPPAKTFKTIDNVSIEGTGNIVTKQKYKTINGESILGDGDIVIGDGGAPAHAKTLGRVSANCIGPDPLPVKPAGAQGSYAYNTDLSKVALNKAFKDAVKGGFKLDTVNKTVTVEGISIFHNFFDNTLGTPLVASVTYSFVIQETKIHAVYVISGTYVTDEGGNPLSATSEFRTIGKVDIPQSELTGLNLKNIVTNITESSDLETLVNDNSSTFNWKISDKINVGADMYITSYANFNPPV